MVSSRLCTFKNWADASTYRTVASSYSKSEVDTAVDAKANSADVYTSSAVDSLLSSKANSSDIPDVSGKLDASALEAAVDAVGKYALASAIPDVSGFALSSAIPDVSGFALASDVSTALAGKGDAADVSALQAYIVQLKLLIQALQASLDLKNADNSNFDYTALLSA